MRPLLVVAALSAGGSLAAQPPAPRPVLMDTDLGGDVGDAFALALVLGSQELDLRGVTAVGGDTQQRAMMLCRFLTMTGRRRVPVAAGEAPQPPAPITRMRPYYYHPDALFDRTTRPVKQTAVEFLHAQLKARPGEVTILATGPLTNVARLLRDKADAKKLIRRVVLVEANLPRDVAAAKAVLASGVPLVVVPAEASGRLSADGVKGILRHGTALTRQVQALYQMQDEAEAPRADALAAAACCDERSLGPPDRAVDVDERGRLVAGVGKPNARVLTKASADLLGDFFANRLASLVPPARRPVAPVPRGGMPHRVHVAEDFETDIERRWWMSGKPETKVLPPGGSRACRGVLTHDFDDLLMPSRQMYTAVIFNPVPGPPMGKHTRLGFRCWLKGADALRVQIYSLTNGYHRHLVLNKLPQGRWLDLTVDMTQARRPDGTGGPLAEGERIDDIQFYADADAELVVDDIVLYDAAPAGEGRPFPRRVHFTGGFDTGAQGKEWPGSFAIVPGRGYFWRAARSVDNPQTKTPWLRVHLRGERPLGKATELSFRYRLTGADALRVALVRGSTKERHEVELKGLKRDAWAEATADFGRAARGGPKEGDRVDEVHFLLPRGAELLLDDVLLYEPGG